MTRLLARPAVLRAPAALFLLAVAVAPLRASDVIAVPTDVFQVQAAIDQASPGDIVVVQPADYGGTLVVDGKGITVVCRGGVARFETLTVRNVPSEEAVVLRGLEGDPSYTTSWTALTIHDNAGQVLLEDCILTAPKGAASCEDGYGGYSPGHFGGTAADVRDSDSVVLVRSTFVGGDGGSPAPTCFGFSSPSAGGHGLVVTNSRVVALDVTVRGGHGGSPPGGLPVGGGCGVLAGAGADLFLGGGSVGGGSSGGDGVRQAAPDVQLRTRDVELLPGAGGLPVSAQPGVLVEDPAPWRTFAATTGGVEGEELELSFGLQDDDVALLRLSLDPLDQTWPGLQGVLLGGPPVKDVPVLPAPGHPSTTVRVPKLPAGTEGLDARVQLFVSSPRDGLVLGPVSVVTILDGGFDPGATLFGAPTTYAVQLPIRVEIADLDGDAVPDLVVATGGATILLGLGDGTFGPPTGFWTGQPGSYGAGCLDVAVADVDGDAVLDIVAANLSAKTLGVVLGQGDGTFASPLEFPAGQSPMAVAVGDLDGDGVPDAVVANYVSNDLSVFLGVGDGTFGPETRDYVGFGLKDVMITDVDGDGAADVLVAAKSVVLKPGAGDGTLAPGVTVGQPGTWATNVTAADLDGDGILDVAATQGSSDTVAVSLGLGGGAFAPQVDYAVGPDPTSVAVADVDLDGVPDLVVSGESPVLAVLLGAGDGTFAIAQAVSLGSGRSDVALADLDGDQRPDLVATYWDWPSALYVLPNVSAAAGAP